MSWSVLCDFDGTIGLQDVIDSLLERFGLPGWEVLEARWQAGLIGSAECMRGQVALLDMSALQLQQHLDGLQIDPAFARFAAAVAARGLPLQIVSDGLDHPIQLLLARHALDHLPVAANRLCITEHPRRWTLQSPYQAQGCNAGTCKCAQICRARERTQQRVLLIGDGTSDFCGASRADYVFAKHRLIDHCRLHGIAHRPIADFADALELLPALLDGDLAPEPAAFSEPALLCS
ncbi:MtnX-like HAD-IB family phosphatase [Xanthomonas prunicola]|uniref:MtnX-like HAD-IB family phosphatase n=1 Tax=Xanthomonas prunicola TaxID=2053930 RepID=UPI0021B32B65|nr:MtnX-like HAD-IB family phosphatase [Xanthomonas prunicola]UXA51149.1 MtnX-like HAD-IB family phosphatase [Xanthomonas prunicola]UXA59389.1 MtnX-like HAD-IB family phosphatase [Xanthomonas prunicola]